MRIWRFHEFGPIENLKPEAAPVPRPAAGEALVRLHFAAINPADRFLVAKQYPRPGKPPLAVGRDGSGEVVEAPAYSGFAPGDRVMLLRSEVGVQRDGTLAEYVTVPVESLAKVPAGWTDEEGAAGGLVQLTAWMALVTEGGLNPAGAHDQVVVVTGASGGVGTAVVMQAKAMGATVVALSRSEQKRQKLMELGADFAIDGEEGNLPETLKKLLNGRQADVVVDNIAGPHLDTWISITGFRGRICVVGMLAGVDVGFNVGKMIFKRIHICGIAVGSQTPIEARKAFAGVVELLSRTGAKPLIDQVYPFDQVQEAFAHLNRGPMGKIVIGPMY